MKKGFLLSCFLVLLSSSSSTSFAQSGGGLNNRSDFTDRLYFGIGAGVDVPVRDFNPVYGPGLGVDFLIGWRLGRLWERDQLELQLDLANFFYLASDEWVYNLRIMPELKYVFDGKGVKPYILGGAGLDSQSLFIGNYYLPIGGFDLAFGAGVQFDLDRRTHFFIEAKYNWIFQAAVTGQDLPVLAGLIFMP